MDERKLVAVTFKHEGEERGIPIGPVHKAFDDGTLEPVGEQLDTELGSIFAWLPMPHAYDLAERLGVPLEES